MTEQFEKYKPEHENPDEISKRRILKMAKESSHDFYDFDVKELMPEDFESERRFQAGKLDPMELQARQQDLDLDHPLNKSQKQLYAYLINKIISDDINKHY